MSLPQLIGLECVSCRKLINSVIDGSFCEECGNPVHRKCVGTSQQAKEDRCQHCGGDPNDTLAKEVRRERGAAKQNLELVRAPATGSAGASAYPLANACPACASTSHTRVRPQSMVAFASDRVCTECGTRYTPPTPLWAAIVFLLAGLLLTGFGGFAIILRMTSSNLTGVPAMICEGFLAIIGVLALVHGIRSLAPRKGVRSM